jgi:D-xylose transport system ATP-binding protein
MLTSPDAAPVADAALAGPVIQTHALTKFYGHVRGADGVDLGLELGEIHGLVGDNGSGKSTLVKMLAGAIVPTSGAIQFEGREIYLRDPSEAYALGISTVHQGLALVGCRSIAENFFLGTEPSRLGVVDRQRMRHEAVSALRALRQMSLPDPDALVSELSGGQRQAVAIGRAIFRGSRVLLLDEPMAALGVQETAQLLELIGELRSPTRSILIISHNLAHVFHLADRITVLRGGRRVGTVRTADVSPDDVIRLITGSAPV